MSRLIRAGVLLSFLLFQLGSTRADDAALFDLARVDGKPLRATLSGLTTKWELKLDDRPMPLPATEWVGLRRAKAFLPAAPSGPHLVLTDGDRLVVSATSLALVDEHLSFACPWLSEGKATRISLGSVAMIWRAAPEGTDAPSLFQRKLLTENRRRDAVVLRNGDVLEGVLVRLDGRGLELKVESRVVKIEMDQLSAVVLSSDLATSSRPTELHGKLVLADCSRVTLRSATCADGRTLTGQTPQGVSFSAPLDRVAALDLMRGRAVYLSDLKPSGYDHTPYLGVSWPLAVDVGVSGRELRLGGHVFDRGLGMHSDSRVRYTLPEGTKRFEALVGLDDFSGRSGHVRLRVLVDGKERELPAKGECSHSSGPLSVNVAVAGGRELTLVVEFGGRGDVGDHVNWVNARLIR